MPRNYKPKERDRKRYEDRDGLTLPEIIEMAKVKNGWHMPALSRQIGVHYQTLKQWKFRGVKEANQIPKLLKLTRLAGLSDPQGIVIILRHMIPTELSDLKQYVGCTVRLYRRKKRPVNRRVKNIEETYERVQSLIPRTKD